MMFYISGPMSGYKDLNLPAFAAASEMLRDLGHYVVSPGEFLQNVEAEDVAVTAKTRARYLRQDVNELSCCDAIFLLKGWRKSTGANIELQVAIMLGMQVYSELMWPLPDDVLPDRELIEAHILELRVADE